MIVCVKINVCNRKFQNNTHLSSYMLQNRAFFKQYPDVDKSVNRVK